MKRAFIHDWLITRGGAEKVLGAMWEVFPSPIYTLFCDEKSIQREPFSQEEIHTSFLQYLPYIAKYHRMALPLFSSAIERLDVSEAQVILSSSHAVAKGIVKTKKQLHICYCHTPMRYAWDLREQYIAPFSGVKKKVAAYLLERMRQWDENASVRVDAFLANSHYIANRIYANYQRRARVIYPPVETERFSLSLSQKEGYYVTHARLVPYKRIDLLVEAFNAMPDKKLVIIGTGPEEKALKSIARKNIEFLGYCEEEALPALLTKAKAYVFAAEEDFGIGVVEAQSAGLPVIAFKKGGACETVVDGTTGVFFERQEIESIILAIKLFEKKEDSFDPVTIRKWAEKFSRDRFKQELFHAVQEMEERFYEDGDLSRWEGN